MNGFLRRLLILLKGSAIERRRVPMESETLIEAWLNAARMVYGAKKPTKPWVIFENGTCVIIMNPEKDPAKQAITLLQEWGPIHISSPAGDFGTITLNNGFGWVVTFDHDDIVTFVAKDEAGQLLDRWLLSPLEIGLLGRSKRGRDAEGLRVVHVEDNRPT